MDSMMNAMGFKRVVDYGEPTHYECPACSATSSVSVPCSAVPTVFCPSVRSPVPVYAVIPKGERPQTTWGETGGDDAVCLRQWAARAADWIIGFDEGNPIARSSHHQGGSRWGPTSSVTGQPYSSENAIRHVAEE